MLWTDDKTKVLLRIWADEEYKGQKRNKVELWLSISFTYIALTSNGVLFFFEELSFFFSVG